MASPKLELNLVQVAAGTLAAVSAAFALSKLGIGGTLTGAAVASVVAGIGSSIYTHSLTRAKDKLKEVSGLAVTELAEQHPESFPTDDDGPHTEQRDPADPATTAGATPGGSAGSGATPGGSGATPGGSSAAPDSSAGSTAPLNGVARLSGSGAAPSTRPSDGPETRVIRPAAVGMARVPTGTLYAPAPPKKPALPTWVSVTIAIVATFLLALGTIEVVERFVLGESMSSLFNKDQHRGSTLFGGGARQDPPAAPSPTPSESPHERESPAPSESPSPTPSTGSPSPPSPSPSASPSPSSPSPTPTPSGGTARTP
ncbi:hypothetical protein AB0M43_33360 [Longispora sp. NPDC051575]|uniref:hypothetical protein n=1 Tax=Longispora sp. NPDC051575 TaxID=3154943 RepID=UPI003430EA8A